MPLTLNIGLYTTILVIINTVTIERQDVLLNGFFQQSRLSYDYSMECKGGY